MRDLRFAPTGERYKTLSAECFSCEDSDLERAVFMGGSIWILGLCVNKDRDSSCCGPVVLADHVAGPVRRRGDI